MTVAPPSATAGKPFFDDFTGSTVDTAKWTIYNRLADQVNLEVNAVIPANARISSGSLAIDAKFEDVSAGDTTTAAPNPRTVHYTCRRSPRPRSSFLYGTTSTCAPRSPGGTGLWPCIWMLGRLWQPSQPYTANVAGADWPNSGWWEIDIAEFVSNHRTTVNNALHFITANRGGSGEKALPFDATTRFMVYRLVWAATTLNWYVDAEDGAGFRNYADDHRGRRRRHPEHARISDPAHRDRRVRCRHPEPGDVPADHVDRLRPDHLMETP